MQQSRLHIRVQPNRLKNRVGRPTMYSQELADQICQLIAEGRSLRSVCRDYDVPSIATIFNWFAVNKPFLAQYARACEERTEAQQEILLEIGDEAIVHAEEANPKAANAVVSGYKLKADNLKWSMSKMKPKKYGDKLDVVSDGKAIVGNTINFIDSRNAPTGE